MKALITSNRRRQGRALAILGLAVLMVVWLLSMWARLSIAEARELAAARPGSEDLSLSHTTLATITVFLPLIYKADIVFFLTILATPAAAGLQATTETANMRM